MYFAIKRFRVMKKSCTIFCLMLFGMLAGIGQAQITVQKFEGEIPVCRWTYGGEDGDMSPMFYPDKEWVQTFAVRFESGDSSSLVYKDVNEHRKVIEFRKTDWKQRNRNLRKLDSVWFPPMFDAYLYKQDGKYGLMTENGVGVAAPAYDRIVFLYQYYASEQAWALCPLILVQANRQYALLHYTGFIVTKFCKKIEELPNAWLMTEANEFKINQRVEPESLWGY